VNTGGVGSGNDILSWHFINRTNLNKVALNHSIQKLSSNSLSYWMRYIMEKNKLKTSPRQIYNCDKTFVPLDCTREKSVTLKKSKNTYNAGTRYIWALHYALCCICSWPTSSPHNYLLQVISRRAVLFRRDRWCPLRESDSGWIDSELFLKWMNKIFIKHVATQWPVILFIAGHKSFRFDWFMSEKWSHPLLPSATHNPRPTTS